VLSLPSVRLGPLRPTLSLLATVSLLTACGGSSSPQPSPSPLTYHAEVNVFYDQDGNGLRDSDEVGAVPNVTVEIGGAKGVSEPATGLAKVDGVLGGPDPVQLTALPPFYVAGAPVTLTVPQVPGLAVYVPATLPIGNNVPALYMAFGDSITDGDGSFDNQGYRPGLLSKLIAHFNQGSMNNQAIGGTRSNAGAARIQNSLGSVKPAYALILYGTNDWNDDPCREDFPCYTIDSLRSMIRAAKAQHTLPVISTIIPCNVGFDARVPPNRQDWIQDMNALIRPMAQEEGAVLVDNYAAFMAVPDYHTLMSDHVHPNDAGYAIMVDQWFQGITTAVAAGTQHEALPAGDRPAASPSPRPHRDYGRPPWPIGPNEE
jgi:lysophospholipase L1-like esterase